jgi:hypothetical protein
MLHNTCVFCSIKFIFIYIGRFTFSSSKTSGNFAEPHQFTEIFIINIDTGVMRGTLDKLLLNATTVSDFKKALPKKHTMQ